MDNLAGGFVHGAERGTATAGKAKEHPAPIAAKQERAGDQQRRAFRAAGIRYVDSLERGMVANGIRGIAVRLHPCVLARVQIDGGDAAPGRFHQR